MNKGKVYFGKKMRRDLWLLLISFVIMVLSGSVICSVINENDISKKLSLLLAGMLVPFVVKSFSRINNIKRIIISTISISLFVLISIIIYPYYTSMQALIARAVWFVMFFSSVLYLEHIQYSFIEFLYKATVIISYFSLFMFVAIELFGIEFPYRVAGNPYLPFWVYWGGFSIFTGHPFNVFGLQFYRLASIFWEPGIYQIFLNIALYYCFFYCSRKKGIPFISLIINLLLTFSTTGYCIFVIIVALWISRNKIFSKYKYLMLIIGGTIAVLLVYFIVLDKKTGAYSGSYNTRISDLIIGLQIFKQGNILFGIGYNNTGIFETTQGLDRGSSNGLVTWLFTMGLVGIAVVIFPFIKNIINETNRDERINKILFFGMFILFNMSEPIYFAPVMWLLVAQEYAKKKHVNRIVTGYPEGKLHKSDVLNYTG